MGIVLEEADESAYWIELLIEADLMSKEHASPLLSEANEMVAMVVASLRTARESK
jgi:four helix bundle protein